MPTLNSAVRLGPVPGEKYAGTATDWPVLVTAFLWSDPASETERPTRTETVAATISYGTVDGPAMRVRSAVRRAVQEFGPAFERLGSG